MQVHAQVNSEGLVLSEVHGEITAFKNEILPMLRSQHEIEVMRCRCSELEERLRKENKTVLTLRKELEDSRDAQLARAALLPRIEAFAPDIEVQQVSAHRVHNVTQARGKSPSDESMLQIASGQEVASLEQIAHVVNAMNSDIDKVEATPLSGSVRDSAMSYLDGKLTRSLPPTIS